MFWNTDICRAWPIMEACSGSHGEELSKFWQCAKFNMANSGEERS